MGRKEQTEGEWEGKREEVVREYSREVCPIDRTRKRTRRKRRKRGEGGTRGRKKERPERMGEEGR